MLPSIYAALVQAVCLGPMLKLVGETLAAADSFSRPALCRATNFEVRNQTYIWLR
jgi:hypothetical protein